MIALEVADLVLIASRTLQLDTDQALELLDPTAAERALAEARSGADSDDPASQAPWLLHALVRQRPLRRGNQQVALVATLQFLALNGWVVDLDPPEAIRTVVTSCWGWSATARGSPPRCWPGSAPTTPACASRCCGC